MLSPATPIPITPAAQPAAQARPASSGASEAFAALLSEAADGEAAAQINPAEGQTAPVIDNLKPEPSTDFQTPEETEARSAAEPTPDAPAPDTELSDTRSDLIGEEANGELDPKPANSSDVAMTDGERAPIAKAMTGETTAPVIDNLKPEPSTDFQTPEETEARSAAEPTPDAPAPDTELSDTRSDLIGEEANGELDPKPANSSDVAMTDGERAPIAKAMTGETAASTDNTTAPVDAVKAPANAKTTPADVETTSAEAETKPAGPEPSAAGAQKTPTEAETTPADIERAPAEIKSQAAALKSDAAPAREAPEVKAQPAAKATGIESQPAERLRQPAADTADIDTVKPEVAAKAANQARALDLADDAMAALAPLKEARPATERTPGELLRGEIRDARGAAAGVDGKPDAKAMMADAKSPAAQAAQTPQASATAPASAPASTLPALENAPAFELLLAQMKSAAAVEPMLADAPIDPALTKSDAAFDPAALRLDARQEMRTASTLQFAQGPRLTPHSAQTMAAQIAQRFNEGSRVFDIRMDPPELGRVEVRLEVGSDNSVRALLAAERAETLAELQRSARDLERALAEAGLELGEDALSFSLTDDGAGAEDFGDEAAPDQPIFVDGDPRLDPLAGPLAPLSTYGFLLTRAEGLDVSV